MFPNEARLRDMTYGMTIHYDVDVEFMDILDENEEPAIVGGPPSPRSGPSTTATADVSRAQASPPRRSLRRTQPPRMYPGSRGVLV